MDQHESVFMLQKMGHDPLKTIFVRGYFYGLVFLANCANVVFGNRFLCFEAIIV